jgi:peptide/nickel transport system substrate-binding protein
MPWSANDKIKAYEYNPEKALELFAEAGIKQGNNGKLLLQR